MRRSSLYALTWIGLVGGLVVVLFGPLPTARANYVVGGAFLAVGVAAVTYLIVQYSGPGHRGPDF